MRPARRSGGLARLAWAVALVAGLGAVECSCLVRRPKQALVVEDGQENIYGFLSAGTLARANAALEDVWDLGPRSKPVKLSPILWNENPFDRYWQFIFYSLRPTSNLLWAYYATGDVRYRDKLREVLASYVAAEESRPDTWASAKRTADRHPFDDRHGAAFRAMVLVNSYGKLRRSGDLDATLGAGLVRAIERLGVFLADPRNFEGHYNHGFTEAAALMLVGKNFPELARAAEWQALGIERLRQMLAGSVDEDGVEVENSPFYHFYVLAFALQDKRWAETYAVPLPDDFGRGVARMFRYATYVPQPDGQVPLQGASVLFDVRRLDPRVYDGEDVPGLPDVVAEPELLYVRKGGTEGREPTERSVLFRASGQSMLRSGFGPPVEFEGQTHVAFNVGPWRSKHNHLDVLAFSYYAAGRALLPDSGLHTYDLDEPSFGYFAGSRGHNTVVVDGLEQFPGVRASEIQDLRELSREAASRVRAGLTSTGPSWAYQSGAHTLYDGVVHKRSVVVLRRDLTLVVDSLTSDVARTFRQTWHLFPGARLTTSGLDVVASADPAGPVLVIRQAAMGSLPVLSTWDGWYSRKYGEKEKSLALDYALTGRAARFATLLASGPYVPATSATSATPRVEATVSGERVTVSVCAAGERFTVDLRNQAADGESLEVSRENGCPP